MYEVIDPGRTNKWIATHVAPNIADVFGHALAVLFGQALLWLVFSPYSDLMPPDMCHHITTAYESVRMTEDATQPVEKSLVTVNRHEAQVFMEVVNHLEVQDINGNNGPAPVMPDDPRPRSARQVNKCFYH